MEFFSNFVSEYGLMILYALLTAFAGFIGAQIKKIYENHVNDETKEKVVATCVKAVEQLYLDLNGEEKLNKAKENIVAMLSTKGIEISDIEIDMLIESCVAEMNLSFLTEAKKARLEAKNNELDEQS